MAKVRFGLSDLAYAVRTVGENNAVSYGTPVKIPGAVSIDLEQQGSSEPFYADNIVYYQAIANMGYQGDLEVAMIPESFMTDILGLTLDTTNNILVETNTAEQATFALIFKVLTDDGVRETVLYNCTAQRPNMAGVTLEDTKSPQTQTLSITATPNPDGKVQATTAAAATAQQLATFLTSVAGYGA